MFSVAARRYAKAFFDLGKDTSQAELLVKEFGRFVDIYEVSQELRFALESPLIRLEEKKAVIYDLSSSFFLGEATQNLLALLVEKRRISLISEIRKCLLEFIDEGHHLARAEITSAKPLSEEYRQELERKLEKLTGKKMVLELHVDPSLMAGIVARVGDTIYDGSLRSKLHSLQQFMLPN